MTHQRFTFARVDDVPVLDPVRLRQAAQFARDRGLRNTRVSPAVYDVAVDEILKLRREAVHVHKMGEDQAWRYVAAQYPDLFTIACLRRAHRGLADIDSEGAL